MPEYAEPMLLPTRSVEKPWGRAILPAPFVAEGGAKIGEIWFEPPPELPELLVKFIFTSEKLSIQCHPSNTQTQIAGIGKQGKEECWLVIDAEPDAVLGVGFDETIGPEAMRAAALDGSIEGLMTWHKVRSGDFFYIPAGTVHAIGAGVSIIEIQQNSDITFRLYDYGRPRELHLEQGVEVAKGEMHDLALQTHLPDKGEVSLVDGPHFRLDRVDGTPSQNLSARYEGRLLVIPREGSVTVAGERITPGQCAYAPSLGTIGFENNITCLITAPMA